MVLGRRRWARLLAFSGLLGGGSPADGGVIADSRECATEDVGLDARNAVFERGGGLTGPRMQTTVARHERLGFCRWRLPPARGSATPEPVAQLPQYGVVTLSAENLVAQPRTSRVRVWMVCSALPEAVTSSSIDRVFDHSTAEIRVSDSRNLTASVAAFGMVLRGSA